MQIIKEDNLNLAIDLINDGEIVAFPTETVYGLGAKATDAKAVSSVFAAKGRPNDNPLIVHVASLDQIDDFAIVDDQVRKLADQFWPGPLTMILKLKKDNQLPTEVTAGLETVAVRMPNNQLTLKLIEATGPIVGPSANLSGKPSPTTAQHVIDDLNGRISAVIDDGPTDIGVESTVVDLTVNQPTILRPGVITAGQLGAKDPSILAILDDKTPKAPGMKYRHYAPDVEVISFDPIDTEALKKELTGKDRVIALEDTLNQLQIVSEKSWSLGQSVKSANEQLYAGLRFFDHPDSVERIFVEGMPAFGEGLAFGNRLDKASGQNHFKYLDN